MLIYFIADYLRQPSIQKRFVKDVKGVLDEFDISPDQRQALRSHDLSQILGAVAVELTELFRRNGPRPDKIRPFFWGTFGPNPMFVNPPIANVGLSTTITVQGTDFPPQGSALLSFQGADAAVNATVTAVESDPSGQSTLTAKVVFNLGQQGEYQVSITDSATGSTGTWPGTFFVLD